MQDFPRPTSHKFIKNVVFLTSETGKLRAEWCLWPLVELINIIYAYFKILIGIMHSDHQIITSKQCWAMYLWEYFKKKPILNRTHVARLFRGALSEFWSFMLKTLYWRANALLVGVKAKRSFALVVKIS